MTTFQEIFGPQGFDCKSVDPTEDFLVPGDYTCKIAEAEVSPTKAGTGHYLKVVLEVVQEGKDKGRKLYDYINIQNPNETAERLAQKSLSALGRATNIWEIKHPQQLLNQILVAVVTKNDNGNNVRTYKPVAQMQSATAADLGGLAPAPAAVGPVTVAGLSPPLPVQAPVVPQTVPPPAAAPVYASPAVPAAAPAALPAIPAAVTPPATAASPAAPAAVAGLPVWQQQQPPGQ